MTDLYEVQKIYAALDGQVHKETARVAVLVAEGADAEMFFEAEKRVDEALDIATLARMLRDRLEVVVARRRVFEKNQEARDVSSVDEENKLVEEVVEDVEVHVVDSDLCKTATSLVDGAKFIYNIAAPIQRRYTQSEYGGVECRRQQRFALLTQVHALPRSLSPR